MLALTWPAFCSDTVVRTQLLMCENMCLIPGGFRHCKHKGPSVSHSVSGVTNAKGLNTDSPIKVSMRFIRPACFWPSKRIGYWTDSHVLIHMSYRYMIIDLCNQSCSAGWSVVAVLWGKNFNIGHYAQTFQINSFIPAMLIGYIDCYHFIPFFSGFDLFDIFHFIPFSVT